MYQQLRTVVKIYQPFSTVVKISQHFTTAVPQFRFCSNIAGQRRHVSNLGPQQVYWQFSGVVNGDQQFSTVVTICYSQFQTGVVRAPQAPGTPASHSKAKPIAYTDAPWQISRFLNRVLWRLHCVRRVSADFAFALLQTALAPLMFLCHHVLF